MVSYSGKWYVKVEGLDEMIADLEKLATGGKMEEAIDKMLKECADTCKGFAKVTVPVITGLLRDSIKRRKTGHLTYEVQAGYPTMQKGRPYYAPFVEFGTRFMAPRSFLLGAFIATLPQFMQKVQEMTR